MKMDANKVRCGWEVILYAVQEEFDRIEGWVIDGFGTRIPMVWNMRGIPKNKENCPAYHYLELVL